MNYEDVMKTNPDLVHEIRCLCGHMQQVVTDPINKAFVKDIISKLDKILANKTAN